MSLFGNFSIAGNEGKKLKIARYLYLAFNVRQNVDE